MKHAPNISAAEPWPLHPDGRRKTMGEMTPDEAREQTRIACHAVAQREGWASTSHISASDDHAAN